jgi:hypothetical protein
MTYTQYRLAKRNGELIQQKRSLEIITKNKWYKPWEYKSECVYGEWEDIEIPEVAI